MNSPNEIAFWNRRRKRNIGQFLCVLKFMFSKLLFRNKCYVFYFVIVVASRCVALCVIWHRFNFRNHFPNAIFHQIYPHFLEAFPFPSAISNRIFTEKSHHLHQIHIGFSQAFFLHFISIEIFLFKISVLIF